MIRIAVFGQVELPRHVVVGLRAHAEVAAPLRVEQRRRTRSASRTAAQQNQSIVPFVSTSAAVCRSPISPWSLMSGYSVAPCASFPSSGDAWHGGGAGAGPRSGGSTPQRRIGRRNDEGGPRFREPPLLRARRDSNPQPSDP